MLWHGSRFSNFVGIMTNGMRIAPPEAPCTGYNFGKGVYLADQATKSEAYCASYLSGNQGLFVLCEAALGNTFDTHNSNSSLNSDKIPKGTNSTYALGRTRPDAKGSEKIEKAIEVPVGDVKNHDGNTWWGPSEFIVYNTNQIRLRYIVKFKQ